VLSARIRDTDVDSKRARWRSQLAAVVAEMLPALKTEAKKRQQATRAKPSEKIGQRPAETGTTYKGAAVIEAAKLVGVGRRSLVTTAAGRYCPGA
jgi:hypothetical protein